MDEKKERIWTVQIEKKRGDMKEKKTPSSKAPLFFSLIGYKSLTR